MRGIGRDSNVGRSDDTYVQSTAVVARLGRLRRGGDGSGGAGWGETVCRGVAVIGGGGGREHTGRRECGSVSYRS